MNASELESLFDEWREMTASERRAIAADDWAAVQQQQERKVDLQKRLDQSITDWKKKNFNAAKSSVHLQPIVAELIALEAGNAQLLATRREQAQRQFAEVSRTGETLRVLNRAYGATAEAHWSSYS